MKKSLFVILLGALFSLVSAQQLGPVNKPKNPSDYPRVTAACKNKVKLYVSNASGRSVKFPETVQCGYDTYACGKLEKFRSEERPSAQGACDDFEAAASALQTAAIEVCCDAPPEEKKPEPKKNCEQPTPWFDGLSPDAKCKNRQQFQTSNDGAGTVFLKMCGWNVFAHRLPDPDPLLVQAYARALLDHVRAAVGSTVCCDSFTASARPGSSCDPRFDLDCDGTSNATDTTSRGHDNSVLFPDISSFGIAPGVPITDTDPLPPWFQPGDKGFMPAANLCDCKWELTKGKRTCSPDGRRNHVYQATWRCPSTGNVKFSRKEAPASEPCGPEEGSGSTWRDLVPFYDRPKTNEWGLVPSISLTRSDSCSLVRR